MSTAYKRKAAFQRGGGKLNAYLAVVRLSGKRLSSKLRGAGGEPPPGCGGGQEGGQAERAGGSGQAGLRARVAGLKPAAGVSAVTEDTLCWKAKVRFNRVRLVRGLENKSYEE